MTEHVRGEDAVLNHLSACSSPFLNGLGRGRTDRDFRATLTVTVLAPPRLSEGGQTVDRIEVPIDPVERLGILCFQTGAVILVLVGDSKILVVAGNLMDPPLADERNIAHDPRGREAG